MYIAAVQEAKKKEKAAKEQDKASTPANALVQIPQVPELYKMRVYCFHSVRCRCGGCTKEIKKAKAKQAYEREIHSHAHTHNMC